MAGEEGARPVKQPTPFLGGRFGEKRVFPLTLRPASAEPYGPLQSIDKIPWVYDRTLEKSGKGEFNRKHNFEIVGGMKGILVVFGVAGPKKDIVVPAEEAYYSEKEGVQEFGFED